MKLAFSPCPNDTFLFHAAIHGLVPFEEPLEATLADIETLNEWALHGKYPVTKVSFPVMREIQAEYALLPVGAALGFGVGPKLIAKKRLLLSDIPHLRIAIPGRHTTAYFLLRTLLEEPKEAHFCLYNQIFKLINEGDVDAGLIIHEQRFTFASSGFYEIADLGALWEERTSLPLPLGCIAAKRQLGQARIGSLATLLKKSLLYAYAHPAASASYIQQHAQERDPLVIQRHIETYITKETLQLSSEGVKAVEKILLIS